MESLSKQVNKRLLLLLIILINCTTFTLKCLKIDKTDPRSEFSRSPLGGDLNELAWFMGLQRSPPNSKPLKFRNSYDVTKHRLLKSRDFGILIHVRNKLICKCFEASWSSASKAAIANSTWLINTGLRQYMVYQSSYYYNFHYNKVYL